jgi:oligopeptide transport system ATP-binding protein
MDSLPRHDITEKSELCPIYGQPPSLVNVPPGCSFSPRCPHAKAICRSQEPPIIEVTPGHSAACHFAGEIGFTRDNAVCPLEVSA